MASFSPDGKWIAVIAEAEGQDFAAYIVSLVDLHNKESFPLAQGEKILNISNLAWSPDSSKLVFSSDVSGTYEIGIYDVGRGDICWLKSSLGEKSMPGWSGDGTKLTYILSRGPETWLVVQSINGCEPELYQIGRGVHSGSP